MIETSPVEIITRKVTTNDYGEAVASDPSNVKVDAIFSAPTVTETGATVAPDGTECTAVLYVTRDSLPWELTAKGALQHAQVRYGMRLFDVVGSPDLDVPRGLHPTEFYETGIPLREVTGE